MTSKRDIYECICNFDTLKDQYGNNIHIHDKNLKVRKLNPLTLGPGNATAYNNTSFSYKIGICLRWLNQNNKIP